MKLLVCGGRHFKNGNMLDAAIKKLPFIPELIIEGGATGADELAKNWAIRNKIHYAEIPALWTCFNRRAGTLRNQAMLLLKPDYCLAMPGNVGTRDMIKRCLSENIPVWSPYK